MKTNIYNKKEHIEGYTGPEGKNILKTDVQKQYDAGNDVNEVKPYGKESNNLIKGNVSARDGYDNSGTQGKDSLSDDSYKNKDSNSNP